MRERILDLASNLFKKKGFRQTTLTEIARALKRQKSSIYYYFPNKEAIFQSIAEMEADMLFDELSQKVNEVKDPLEALHAYINHRIYTMHHIAGRYRSIKEELLPLLPLIEQARQGSLKREVGLVNEILVAGENAGVFALKESMLTANLIVNSLKGYEIPMYITAEIGYKPPEVEQLVHLFTYGLLTRK